MDPPGYSAPKLPALELSEHHQRSQSTMGIQHNVMNNFGMMHNVDARAKKTRVTFDKQLGEPKRHTIAAGRPPSNKLKNPTPQMRAILNAHFENAELRKKFLKDFYSQNGTKKFGFHLLKNRDLQSLDPAKCQREDDKAVDSPQKLKAFHNIDNEDPGQLSKESLLIPQKEIFIHNTLDWTNKTIKRPDIEIKQRDSYRENYFKILSKDTKSFNLKKGDFTRLVDQRIPLDRDR